MISKETIDRVFDTARIEEVVGDFVSLKKRGTNWLGLCPFHNEKTPSFNVANKIDEILSMLVKFLAAELVILFSYQHCFSIKFCAMRYFPILTSYEIFTRSKKSGVQKTCIFL